MQVVKELEKEWRKKSRKRKRNKSRPRIKAGPYVCTRKIKNHEEE